MMEKLMAFEQEPLHRQIYAWQMLAKAGIASDDRLLAAFAAGPREICVGPPPWVHSEGRGYRDLASKDPLVIYQDVVIGLDTARGVNNGMPSLHAGAIHALSVRQGETVVHLGAGTGYYTAILAEMAGPSSRIIAVEFDLVLAKKCRQNLAHYPNVDVIEGDATQWPVDDADVIYANFALDHPPARWVDRLSVGGRLLFPLGIPATENGKSSAFTRMAAFLMIERHQISFGARFLQAVSFVWAEGQEPPPKGRQASLEEAFRGRRLLQVRSLRWKTPPQQGEWYGEGDWGLSFEEA